MPIIKTLINDNNLEILITTITLSSSKIVEENIGNNEIIHHRFFPVDTVCLIRKFLSLWKPNAIFLVDSEIWPNLISQAKKKNISLAIINARITKKSFDKWRLVPSRKGYFGKIDICLVSLFNENVLQN